MYPLLNIHVVTSIVVYFLSDDEEVTYWRYMFIPRTRVATNILHQKTKDPRLRHGRWSCGFT